MTRTSIVRAGLAAAIVSGGLALAGCSNSPMVRGKIIPGTASVIGVTDTGDERVKGSGIAAADLVAHLGGGRGADESVGGPMLGRTRSDKDGTFEMRLNDGRALTRPVILSVSAPGFAPATGPVNLPGANRQVLVVLKRTDAGR